MIWQSWVKVDRRQSVHFIRSVCEEETARDSKGQQKAGKDRKGTGKEPGRYEVVEKAIAPANHAVLPNWLLEVAGEGAKRAGRKEPVGVGGVSKYSERVGSFELLPAFFFTFLLLPLPLPSPLLLTPDFAACY